MSFLPLLDTQGQRATAGLQQWFTFFRIIKGKVSFSSYPAQLSSWPSHSTWPGLCRINATHAVDAQSKKQSTNKWKKWKKCSKTILKEKETDRKIITVTAKSVCARASGTGNTGWRWRGLQQFAGRRACVWIARDCSPGRRKWKLENKTFHIDVVTEIKIKNWTLAKPTNAMIVDAVAALQTDAEKKPILVIGKPPSASFGRGGLVRGQGSPGAKKTFLCWLVKNHEHYVLGKRKVDEFSSTLHSL